MSDEAKQALRNFRDAAVAFHDAMMERVVQDAQEDAMSDERKAIFSEGVTVEVEKGGNYRVTDIASGLPIFGLTGIDIRVDHGGLFRRAPVTVVELQIDTSDIRCVLVMEADAFGKGSPDPAD